MGFSSGSGIGEAIVDVLLQPNVAPVSSGSGGGASGGWRDDDEEESDTRQAKSLLEDYRNELVEIKAQPSTPAVTIIDKNIVEAAVTTVIEKGHTNATFLTKPERPTSLKGVPG